MATLMALKHINVTKGLPMTITLLYGHPTAKGPVFIGQGSDGRYHPLWKGESLGPYPSATAAIDDVSGGHTYTPSDGCDMGSLGLSSDIADWLPAKDVV